MTAFLLLPLLAAHVSPASQQAVVCRSIGLDPVRLWTFEPTGETWRVTHQVEGAARRVVLVLPNAQAAFSAEAVSLRSRTANGGIDVTLSGPREKATLDAYVNYELEVNVDASLTPEMDEIDTDGPVGVSCGDPAAAARLDASTSTGPPVTGEQHLGDDRRGAGSTPPPYDASM